MWLKINIEKKLLGIILLAGFILRFYHFTELPFTWDELSAWSRLQFPSFSELIEYGVKPDGHPAGVQVFLYYWTSLFGDSEWVVKLPFNIMGLASIYVFYVIAKIWWNKNTGLIAASFMASMQFFVLYSPIARPYISGLFLTLMMVVYWSKYLFEEPKRKYLITFVLFAALSAYNHHFSLLFAAIVGLTGLFFIKKDNIRDYILSGILIFVLYIPHLPIFFHQLAIGGIGGQGNWLGKPSASFPLEFLYWAFHYSYLVLTLVFFIILLGIFSKGEKENSLGHKKRLVLLLWFVIPLAIGYYYSIWVNPVIQFSMLIFSFPYLLLLLFSGIKKTNPWLISSLVIFILIVNISTLVFSRQHYRIIFKQPFAGTAKSLMNTPEIQADEIFLIYNSIPAYQQYYLKKYHLDTTHSFSIYHQYFTLNQMDSLLQSRKEKYILASGLPESFIPFIYSQYPYLLHREDGYTYESYLFSKDKQKSLALHHLVSESSFGIEKAGWNAPENRIQKDSSGISVFTFQEEEEWGISFSDSIKNMHPYYGFIIDMEAELQLPKPELHALWTATISFPNKKDVWRGHQLFQQIIQSPQGNKSFYSLDTRFLMNPDEYPNTLFKTYFWNKNKDHFNIKKVRLYTRRANPIKYGLFKEIL